MTTNPSVQDPRSYNCTRLRGEAEAQDPRGGDAGQGERVTPTLSPEFFKTRGVARTVWEARPYIPYAKGDTRLLRHHWPQSKSHASRIARQCGGIIIPRQGPAGLRTSWVPAELRPDEEVVTSSHWHYHGDNPDFEAVFPTTGNPLPKRYRLKAENVTAHILKAHGGENVQTVHLDENRAKYVFPTGEGAKRLDMHPHAWTRFSNAPRVFFVIEGCLKADAVFSAGEAVFSVPSVTLWDAPELEAFARRHLRGRPVYIVPDRDVFDPTTKGHSSVVTQALFCRTLLHRWGVDAHVAAPPLDQKHKGVDDYLGDEGKITDLDVLERETPHAHGYAEWLADKGKRRKDRTVRDAETIRALALHADANGQFQGSLRKTARVMGVHHSRVQRAVHDLIEDEAITVDGSLEEHARYYSRDAQRWVGWDWVDRPTITITPELRAVQSTHKLG